MMTSVCKCTKCISLNATLIAVFFMWQERRLHSETVPEPQTSSAAKAQKSFVSLFKSNGASPTAPTGEQPPDYLTDYFHQQRSTY